MAKFKLTSLDKIVAQQPANQWLVKNHMEINSIGMLFGAPASAKSFIAMDIAFCIAAGIDWNGNETIQGKVVYLAGEGYSGMSKRFKALGIKYNTTTSDIFLSELPASLTDSNGGEAVEKAIKELCPNPTLIIIDTLHRNFGCADENSALGFSAFLSVLDDTIRKSKPTILLVHHSGHSSSDRSRGSSAIKAALDFEYKIDKKEQSVSMECTKAKEFAEPEPIAFDLTPVTFDDWIDDEGIPLGSAILEPSIFKHQEKVIRMSPNDQLVLNALQESIKNHGEKVPDGNSSKDTNLVNKVCVANDYWKKEAYSEIKKNNNTTSPQALQKAFKRAKDKLLKIGKIKTNGDLFWINDS